MLRRLPLLAAVPACTAAAVPLPPAALAPYVGDGHFEPGDYGWMRGAFAGATAAQTAEWQAIRSWLDQCHAAGAAAIRADLARRGVAASAADLDNVNDGLCGEVSLAGRVGDQGSAWPTFQAAVARARPVAQAVIWSAALAQAEAEPPSDNGGAALMARPVSDQILRMA